MVGIGQINEEGTKEMFLYTLRLEAHHAKMVEDELISIIKKFPIRQQERLLKKLKKRAGKPHRITRKASGQAVSGRKGFGG